MTFEHRHYTCDPKLEVAGNTALSFIDNLGSKNTEELVKKHGLDTIDVKQWYPVQKLFDFFNDVADEMGTQPFVAMGMKVAEQSEFPEDMIGNELSLQQILEGWQAHYEANHRGADFPPVKTNKLGERHYQLQFSPQHLYPFDLVYGMAYGFCKLLLPKGTPFTVTYVDGHTPHDHDGQSVVVDVSW